MTTKQHMITWKAFQSHRNNNNTNSNSIQIVVVVFHHEIRPMWPVSVSIWTPSNRRLRRLPIPNIILSKHMLMFFTYCIYEKGTLTNKTSLITYGL
jgi:hypothetical protein